MSVCKFLYEHDFGGIMDVDTKNSDWWVVCSKQLPSSLKQQKLCCILMVAL